MDSNFGEIALACALGKEMKYTDSSIAEMVGLAENQVGWIAQAARNGVLRNILEACDSIPAFCLFMDADPGVRMQIIKTAIETGEYVNQKAIEVARRRVLARTPRKTKTTIAGENRRAM